MSYTLSDRSWAEWIAWRLESHGHTVYVQAWDSRPGAHVLVEMDAAATSCERTIAVVSPEYLTSESCALEWHAAMWRDRAGTDCRLVPVMVRECDPSGMLAPVQAINLVGLDEATASSTLLAGLSPGRVKPESSPGFPGAATPFPPDMVASREVAAPRASIARLAAARPAHVSAAAGRWGAFAHDGAVWLAEARGRDLAFRSLHGTGERGQPWRFDAPVKDVAIAETGNLLIVHVGMMLHFATVAADGPVRRLSTSDTVAEEHDRLLALRDPAQGAGLEVVVATADETIGITPRRLLSPRRRTMMASPSRAAAEVRGRVLLVDEDGRMADGGVELDALDSWIDVDCASSATVALVAGIGRARDMTVLCLERHGPDGIQQRTAAVDGEPNRVRVVRTPDANDVPCVVIAEVDRQLRLWAWDDLPASTAGSDIAASG